MSCHSTTSGLSFAFCLSMSFCCVLMTSPDRKLDTTMCQVVALHRQTTGLIFFQYVTHQIFLVHFSNEKSVAILQGSFNPCFIGSFVNTSIHPITKLPSCYGPKPSRPSKREFNAENKVLTGRNNTVNGKQTKKKNYFKEGKQSKVQQKKITHLEETKGE